MVNDADDVSLVKDVESVLVGEALETIDVLGEPPAPELKASNTWSKFLFCVKVMFLHALTLFPLADLLANTHTHTHKLSDTHTHTI